MDTSSQLVDRVCVITGANTGIGKQTALELARRGARLVLACRSQERTQPVLDEIRSAHGNDRAEFLSLNLSSLASIRQSADELLGRNQPIHLLINNAGLAGQRGQTDDGFELAFGVNHLGHFLFTELLTERLLASGPARIVIVSSNYHYKALKLDLTQVQRHTKTLTGIPEYAVSKLANALHAAELARRHADTKLEVCALHPGVIASDVWRRVPWPIQPLMKRFMKSPTEGARATVFCASEPSLPGPSGSYYDEGTLRTPSRLARDAQLAATLWERSAAWCGC